MKKSIYLATVIMAAMFSMNSQAEESKNEIPHQKKSEQGSPLSEDESSVVESQITINGKKIPYKAIAGVYQFKDDNGKPKGRFFYVAYTRSDIDNKSNRPIAFSFNGGPGASSVWMHMGLLGPKRVALKDGAAYVPPFSYENNDFSLLDATDLVFIDPISTGYSRVPPGEDAKQFHTLEEDVKSVGEFIRLYTTRNSRWDSPKYLIGASYGTMRAVELANYLYDQFNLATNGAILISSVLNFQTIESDDGNNDLPFVLFLPSYTATAWAHKKLPEDLQADPQKAMKDAKEFALNQYALALLQGDKLSPSERKNLAEKLGYYTGLKPEIIELMNFRIKPLEYMQELYRDEGMLIGRFDSRFKGKSLHNLANRLEYDPSMDAIFSAFTSTFNEYVRNELKWVKDDEYKVLANVFPWNYGRDNRYFSAVPSLREVMIRLPSFTVFVASGFFDLATPFLGADYTFNHLNLGDEIPKRITMKYYPGGHMMYTDMPALEALSKDLHQFIEQGR